MKKQTTATEKILEFFKENESVFNDCITELDGWNGYLNDERYYPMDELNEIFSGTSCVDILNRAYFGYDLDSWTTDSSGNKIYNAFNPNREFFTFNGYGNLVSTDYIDYSDFLDDYFIQALSESRSHIWVIDSDDELSALFDELDAEGEQ